LCFLRKRSSAQLRLRNSCAPGAYTHTRTHARTRHAHHTHTHARAHVMHVCARLHACAGKQGWPHDTAQAALSHCTTFLLGAALAPRCTPAQVSTSHKPPAWIDDQHDLQALSGTRENV
jgi:hypothetical protein